MNEIIERLEAFFTEHSTSRRTDAAKDCSLFFYEFELVLAALKSGQAMADAINRNLVDAPHFRPHLTDETLAVLEAFALGEAQ